mmetsp:Transcript_21435/g.46582  ORF Transcript_21435/g.46582 Transcript_21435/m.46582 type:complete len:237 (+) Transcript_21435:568-1278(+)
MSRCEWLCRRDGSSLGHATKENGSQFGSPHAYREWIGVREWNRGDVLQLWRGGACQGVEYFPPSELQYNCGHGQRRREQRRRGVREETKRQKKRQPQKIRQTRGRAGISPRSPQCLSTPTLPQQHAPQFQRLPLHRSPLARQPIRHRLLRRGRAPLGSRAIYSHFHLRQPLGGRRHGDHRAVQSRRTRSDSTLLQRSRHRAARHANIVGVAKDDHVDEEQLSRVESDGALHVRGGE